MTESNKLDQEILSQVKNDIFNRKTIDNLLGKLRELEFIDDHFNDEETNKVIFEKAKLNLIEDVESYEDFRS